MLRTGATRTIFRTLTTATPRTTRATYRSAYIKPQFISPLRSANVKRSQVLSLVPFRPISTSVRLLDKIDKKHEEKIAKGKVQPDPDAVSVSSSTVPVFGGDLGDRDTDMLAGIRADMKTIKETFNLTDVPREAYYIGLAGVLPYLATSLTTLYMAWDINYAAATGHGFLLSGQNAEILLHILEPLQVGYGAVIISFLGAIHWGLEFAGYGGHHKYRRYAIGVVAPAVAWPTILLPVEYALIVQFLAFNFLYFADARATQRGWAPPWYGTYRFVLTFIVGTSIVLSLVGRGQIGDQVHQLPGASKRLMELQDWQWEGLEKEEQDRRAKMVAEEEAAEDDDAEAQDEKEDDEK